MSRVSTTRIFCRLYATESSLPKVDHSHYGLHLWPRSKKPTPHEIFNVTADYLNRKEYEKSLKATYQKFIKLYHPDRCATHDVVDGAGKALLATQKRQRFDEIQNAYDILKDPGQSVAYQRYQNTTWGSYQRGKTDSFNAYRMANAHRAKYSYHQDPKFWQAGTWEDYYQMRYGRSAPTREEWEKNKWKILWKVLAVASVVVALQIMLAVERTGEFNRQIRMMNLRSNADLSEAYNNYDEGQTRFQRIRRFLLYRRLGLETRDDDGIKKEENEMLTKYAQRKVAALEE